MNSTQMMDFLAHKISNEHLHNIIVGVINSVFKPVGLSDVVINVNQNGEDVDIDVKFNSTNFGNFVSQSGFVINADNVKSLYHSNGLQREILASSVSHSIKTIESQLVAVSNILEIQDVGSIIKNIDALNSLVKYFDLVDDESKSVLSFIHYITKLMEFDQLAVDVYENPTLSIGIKPKLNMGCDIMGVKKGNGLINVCSIQVDNKFKNINSKLMGQLICNTIRSIENSNYKRSGNHAMICTEAFFKKVSK